MEKEQFRETGKTDFNVYAEIKELIVELQQMRNAKAQLVPEKEKLKTRVDRLKSELIGMDVVISSTEKDIEANESRINDFGNSLRNQDEMKERLLDEINLLQLNIRTVTDDINNCLAIEAHLDRDLLDISGERTLIVNKLKKMEEGVKSVVMEKMHKLPHLKQYNSLLKKVQKAFKEVENKMDVTLKFTYHRYIE
ncbi:MAG: hypothetical protein HQK89_03295 [Nitrospirae bacterium]|nr:hypothetical protein [Nitrospirota bacterium]